MTVEDDERVVVLESTAWPCGLTGHRNVEGRFRDLLHHGRVRLLNDRFDGHFVTFVL